MILPKTSKGVGILFRTVKSIAVILILISIGIIIYFSLGYR